MGADRINYLAGDFDSLRSELNAKLAVLPGWKDQVESGVGSTLVRMFAYVADLLCYRMNVLANEAYLDTVQIKENMMKIIKLLNYKVKRAVPSHGDLTLWLKNASASNVVIPQGTRLSTADNILFYTVYENEIIAGDKEISVKAVQGVEKEISYVSDGSLNQEFLLNSDSKNYYIGGAIWPNSEYSYSGLTVYVDDVEWTEIDSLVNATETDTNYYAEQYSDYAVRIVFGDGEFGKIPPTGSNIKFVYNLNIGKFGNVNDTAINKVLDTINNTASEPVTVYVSQPTSFLNAGDPEDLESIRTNAPKYYTTGDRAITSEDIDALISSNFSNILDIYILAEEDKTPPNFKEFNQITIGLLLKDVDGSALVPDANGENYLSYYESVDELIKKKRSITVHRKYIIPDPIEIYFKVNYKKYEGYSDTSARAAIQGAIEQYLLDYGRLGSTIKHSDIVYAIESLPSVDWCYLQMKRSTDVNYSTQNITCTETQFPVHASAAYLTLTRET
jgi:phage-related baseplate assembly protein